MNINIIQSRIIKRICLLIGVSMILMAFQFEALADDSLKTSPNNIGGQQGRFNRPGVLLVSYLFLLFTSS